MFIIDNCLEFVLIFCEFKIMVCDEVVLIVINDFIS